MENEENVTPNTSLATIPDREISGVKSLDRQTSEEIVDKPVGCKSKGNIPMKRGSASDVIELSSEEEDEFEVLSNFRAKKPDNKRIRQQKDVTQKQFAKILQLFPIIYDPDHKGRDVMGALTAAYNIIGEELGLSQKSVSQRWHRIRKGSKSAPHLSFLRKFEPPVVGPIDRFVVRPSKEKESSDNDVAELSTDDSGDGDCHDEPSGTVKRPAFVIDYKKTWNLPKDQFSEYVHRSLVGLSGENTRKTKKRIVKLLENAKDEAAKR